MTINIVTSKNCVIKGYARTTTDLHEFFFKRSTKYEIICSAITLEESEIILSFNFLLKSISTIRSFLYIMEYTEKWSLSIIRLFYFEITDFKTMCNLIRFHLLLFLIDSGMYLNYSCFPLIKFVIDVLNKSFTYFWLQLTC